MWRTIIVHTLSQYYYYYNIEKITITINIEYIYNK